MTSDGLQNKKDPIQTILQKIDNGQYQIPDFQRSYVWKKKDVMKLLDSIFHEYPTGALLTLVRDDGEDSATKYISNRGFYGTTEVQNDACKVLVLDGQQRLTSCYHVFYDKSKSYRYYINLEILWDKWKKSNGDIDSLYFYDCISTRSEKGKTDSIQGCLLPFSLIRTQKSFSTQRTAYADILKRKGSSVDPEYIKFIEIELDSLLKPFLDYQFSTIELTENLRISAVCRIFETLNNTGMKLDSFDICVAKFMRDGLNLKTKVHESKITHSVLKILFDGDKNREMPLQVIALSTNAESHLKNRLVDSLEKQVIEDNWDDSIKSIVETMEILDDVGVGTNESLKLLPYPAIIPVVASALIKTGYFEKSEIDKSAIKDKIHIYFYTACLTQRFTQGAASMMKTDYDLLCKWFDNNESPDFITNGVSWIDEVMLKISNKINAISSAFYCILNTNAPKDLYTKKEIKAFDKDVDLHHLFPQKCYEKKFEVNRALNMAYLLKSTNESIMSHTTDSYSDEIITGVFSGKEEKLKELMKSQLITDDCYEAFRNQDYNLFITKRADAFIDKFESIGVKINRMSVDQASEEEIAEIEEEGVNETSL